MKHLRKFARGDSGSWTINLGVDRRTERTTRNNPPTPATVYPIDPQNRELRGRLAKNATVTLKNVTHDRAIPAIDWNAIRIFPGADITQTLHSGSEFLALRRTMGNILTILRICFFCSLQVQTD
jgi:hypothetical protein